MRSSIRHPQIKKPSLTFCGPLVLRAKARRRGDNKRGARRWGDRGGQAYPLLSSDNVGARRRGDGVGAGGVVACSSGDGEETTGMPRGQKAYGRREDAL